MKTLIILFVVTFFVFCENTSSGGDKCTLEIVLKHTPVINQGSTGTCWSFATTSFLESEILRLGFPETDLSEMYFVEHAYRNKAVQYLKLNGEVRVGQGGQAHDVLDVVREQGFVPAEVFPGKMVKGRFNHRELASGFRKELEILLRKKDDSGKDKTESVNSLLRQHIGKMPGKFRTEKGMMNPGKYFNQFGIDPDDYIELTSYGDYPFYSTLVLNVPDNWSKAGYYNLPLDELIEVMTNSLQNGYTFCWDGDTSEKTFNHKNGMAEWPEKLAKNDGQDLRQKTFNDKTTTDDHLMHVVGLSRDQSGNTCFYTKNSWGAESNSHGGYLHMSEDYVRLKTIAILVHKDAIPEKIRQKLNLD